MSEPVLRIETTRLEPGGLYEMPFFIGGLNVTPIIYSVNNGNWSKIPDDQCLGWVNGEYKFYKSFDIQRHGQKRFTFYLFVQQGSRLFCWMVDAVLDVPSGGGNVSIVIDNSIKNNVNGDANAVYQPIDGHNIDITFNTQQNATPQSIPLVRKAEFETSLPIGNRSESSATRWKLKFPGGKETVLLMDDKITVGRSSKHSIFFKGSEDNLLYSSVMSASSPLTITVEQNAITFHHDSDRHITVTTNSNTNNPLKKGTAIKSGLEGNSLLFEYFMPLNIKPATKFTLNNWMVNSSVPLEVLRDLLSGGDKPCVLPPLHFSTSAQHPLDQNPDKLEQFVKHAQDAGAKNAAQIAGSLEYFKRNSQNRYAYRDYYFLGAGLKCTFSNEIEAVTLPVNGCLFMLFPRCEAKCGINNSEFDINAGQPVMLRNGMEITINGKSFTAESF